MLLYRFVLEKHGLGRAMPRDVIEGANIVTIMFREGSVNCTAILGVDGIRNPTLIATVRVFDLRALPCTHVNSTQVQIARTPDDRTLSCLPAFRLAGHVHSRAH